MVTWADTDAAIEAVRFRRQKRVETTTLLTALSLLLCAIWLAWPSLKALVNGDGVVLTSFGAPLLLLLWGIFVQDATLDDPNARSRLGSSTAVAWPILLALGALGLEPALNHCWAACLSLWSVCCAARFRGKPCVGISAFCATVQSLLA